VKLAEIDALITGAEAELAALKLHIGRKGRVPDPSDAFDPVGCLELWLAALYASRARLLDAFGQAPFRLN
jgi:hypothetical protein